MIDSPSTDKTVEICEEFPNVEVVVHKYPGNQAEQFNWAIDNLQISTEWVLRIDADEYILRNLLKNYMQKSLFCHRMSQDSNSKDVISLWEDGLSMASILLL